MKMSSIPRLLTIWCCLCVAATPALADHLPYADDSDEQPVRKFRAGAMMAGIRHLGGQGFGLFMTFGPLNRSQGHMNWGAEGLFVTSGERRLLKEDAHNTYFESDSMFASVRYVYETASTVGLGLSAYRVLRDPPPGIGSSWPGVAIGLSAGLTLETDRVGLRSSDYEYYYGYVSYSDTDISILPYVHPHLVLSQGAISLFAGATLLADYPTWTVGLAYAW